MKESVWKRALAFVFMALLVLAVTPLSAFAEEGGYTVSIEGSSERLEGVVPLSDLSGLETAASNESLAFGTWYTVEYVRGGYTEEYDEFYNYRYTYHFELSEDSLIKFEVSTTRDYDFVSGSGFLSLYGEGGGSAIWTTNGTFVKGTGKSTSSEVVKLAKGNYFFAIGLGYAKSTPLEDWPDGYWGTASFRLSKVNGIFNDVLEGSWYYNVVKRAVNLGLMKGYGSDKTGYFGSNDNLTRGQMAVILWNMAGNPADYAGAKSFSDVSNPKAYFYSAVRWASAHGVVSGGKDGKFRPNDNVSRQDLAVMLANYASKYAGLTLDGSAADYSSMSDSASVSGYAAPSLGWCFKNKILSGNKGKILPKNNATRAEAAKMVVALYDILAK